jgi:apolipoprotein N-acyltransferase
MPPAPANVGSAEAEQTLVRIVQPNAPQSEKWLPEKARDFFDRSVALSEAAPENGGRRPDLIVWPETSIPVWLDEADVAIGMISRALPQTPVIAGLQRADRLRFFNTAVVIDDGYVTDFYDKAQLVPFGEYLPFGGLLSKLGIYGLAANEGGGFSRGVGMRTLQVGDVGRAQILICYEGIFPHLAGATKERPAFFALITNDGWFGNWAGPRQHLVQAQFRSLEQGIPMLRSANTGISAIIDARGRVTAQLGMNQTGFIDAGMAAARKATLYARTRDWPIIGVFTLWLIGTSVLVWRRSSLT